MEPVYIIRAPSRMLLVTIVKVMATILRVIFQLTLSYLMNTECWKDFTNCNLCAGETSGNNAKYWWEI